MVWLLSRAIHYLYTLLTGHAAAFAVVGFFLFVGVFAGAATGESVGYVGFMGWIGSVALATVVCVMLILMMVSPFFTPVTLLMAALCGFNVGYRLPLLRVDGIMGIPAAFLGGLGSMIACAGLCAAYAVSLGRSFAWVRGVRIPTGERLGRMVPEMGAVMLFMLVYVTGAVFAGFGF